MPIFLEAIARGSASMPFMLPEHIAKTDPYTQITDATGSGPYRLNTGDFVPRIVRQLYEIRRLSCRASGSRPT